MGTVVVTGGCEDGGVLADDDGAADDGSWLAEVDGATSWAAAPVGSTCWSVVRTTQKVATRPTVRVAATAMGSFRLAVCSVLCRPGIREHLALGTGHAHTGRHITK
ncbi:hypothetical protein GCM10011609_26120 [Lentzea pudingi]|uniref:Uncharacterized protein n=1 Tax=Lentzea pudingi TaxID=1789439 RepID=A0ABQ2HRU7_9PSEU|nr:hypothetical protein GCM10011609_26120 [Lentzea pudingi]